MNSFNNRQILLALITSSPNKYQRLLGLNKISLDGKPMEEEEAQEEASGSGPATGVSRVRNMNRRLASSVRSIQDRRYKPTLVLGPANALNV